MFRDFFLTQFTPTAERTQRWLTNVVLPDDTRILFLIRDATGRPVGNFGVCGIREHCAELDNLIRGERGGDARLVFGLAEFSAASLTRAKHLSTNNSAIWRRRSRRRFQIAVSSVLRLCHPCYQQDEEGARMAEPGHG